MDLLISLLILLLWLVVIGVVVWAVCWAIDFLFSMFPDGAKPPHQIPMALKFIVIIIGIIYGITLVMGVLPPMRSLQLN